MRKIFWLGFLGVLSAFATPETIIGWDGDLNAVRVKLAGELEFRRDDPQKILHASFRGTARGLHRNWSLEAGYLPMVIHTLSLREKNQSWDLRVSQFADQVNVAGADFVIVYSRVEATNLGEEKASFDPQASSEWVALPGTTGARDVEAGASVSFDYALAVDQFGRQHPWPQAAEIARAGSFEEHHAHMRDYWLAKLSQVTEVNVPDERFNNLIRATYLYTLITKDGHDLKPGEFTYDFVYDHDSIGIVMDLLTRGHFAEAPELLKSLRYFTMFPDGTWKLSWPFAFYAFKTGDLAPARARWPELVQSVTDISASRTGPNGILKQSRALDIDGYWTVDDYSALLGLWSFAYLADQLGEANWAAWARAEYESLLDSTNRQLALYMQPTRPSRIPAAIVDPEQAPRAVLPGEANWASHFLFGHWLWDGWLMQAPQRPPTAVSLEELIDATYEYGFARVQSVGYEPHNFGSYGGYSTGYNAAYAASALRGQRFRNEPLAATDFVLRNLLSGPSAWWESMGKRAPSDWADGAPHPGQVIGDCPHIWAQALTTKMLQDALVAESWNGDLHLGRGISDEWLNASRPISVKRFPIAGNRRLTFTLRKVNTKRWSLELAGDVPRGKVRIELPYFQSQVVESDAGVFDARERVLTLNEGSRSVQFWVR